MEGNPKIRKIFNGKLWRLEKNTGTCEPDLCFGVIKLPISKYIEGIKQYNYHGNFEWLAHNSALFGLILKIDPCAEWDEYLRKGDANYYKSPSFRRLWGGIWEESYWIIRNRKKKGLFEETAWIFSMTHQANIDPFPKPFRGKSKPLMLSGLCSDRLADAQNHLWGVSVWKPCLPEARLAFQPVKFPSFLGAKIMVLF